MDIAFFVSRFPELSHTFILSQARGLRERGHRVTLFADLTEDATVQKEAVDEFGLGDAVVPLDRSREPLPGDLAAVAPILLRAPRTLGYLRRGRALPFGGRSALLRKLLVLRASGCQPDVVHCHFGDLALRSLYAGTVWPVPLVASFYGADCSRYPRRRGAGVYRPLFHRADCVTVLSGEMEERLRALGCPPERLRRQPIGVDPERFPFRRRGTEREEGPVRFLTTARLVEKKGVAHALRALRRLSAHVDWRYEVVGDGPLREELEGLARSLGVAPRVTFHGARPQGEIREAMHRAHVFVLPSVAASDGDREGTPTVLMEAAASGLPVVSTRHAGIPEVVRDRVSGLLVPERDEKALADALATLALSPERWTPMGRAGRRHVERHFNARLLAGKLESLYEELASPGHRARSRSAREEVEPRSVAKSP